LFVDPLPGVLTTQGTELKPSYDLIDDREWNQEGEDADSDNPTQDWPFDRLRNRSSGDGGENDPSQSQCDEEQTGHDGSLLSRFSEILEVLRADPG
jgi:hypothetical protein